MARVSISGDELIVDVEGLDKLWALTSRLSIPLANVRGATADPGITKEAFAVKVAGATVPGLITAGTFITEGERVFWDVHDRKNAVVIELGGEKYVRLVIEVDDPAATVDLIEGAIGHPNR
jgi:hypothetical protein